MPRLLFRYVLMDVLRVVGLTATVLVTIIAFGATIKPLATDTLLDAAQTMRFLVLVMVPMLQFALPFAAGFGATLSLHRMTTDNEILAMSACGVSYRRILMPVIALGITLTLVMVLLTQWVIPVFVTLIQQTIVKEVPKLFEASIRRGEAFQVGRLQIYAADIIVKPWPEGPDGPQTRMILPKVAAAELDGDDRIVTDVTANTAVVDVYRREGRTYLKMVMSDAVAFKPDSGGLFSAPRWEPGAVVIPASARDNVKAMTQTDLLALRTNPDHYRQVTDAREALAEAMRDADARNSIDIQLRNTGQIELIDDSNAAGELRRTYAVHADRLNNTTFAARDGGKIEIIQFEGGTPARRFTSADVTLIPAVAGTFGNAVFDLVIGAHEVSDMRPGGPSNQREHLSLANLTLPGASKDDLLQLSSAELVARAATTKGRLEGVKTKSDKLHNEINSLGREIVSRLMSRYALSLTACLLLLLGALLAIRMRGSLPLTVYALAFLPAIANLVMIAAGEQFLRDGRLLGGIVMWSGDAIMLAMCAITYRQISRN